VWTFGVGFGRSFEPIASALAMQVFRLTIQGRASCHGPVTLVIGQFVERFTITPEEKLQALHQVVKELEPMESKRCYD